MMESSSESELASVCSAGGGGSTGGGLTGGGSAVLVSSVVSLLFPLSIKVCRDSGDGSVTRVGLLLRVLADTGVLSVNI